MNPASTKITIAGAGIGGLTAAIALKQAGFEVSVLERFNKISAAGAGISLQMNAMAALDRLGLTETILKQGNIITAAEIRLRGKNLSQVPVQELSDKLGHPFVAIHRARLQELLVEALGAQHLRTGADVKHAEQVEDHVRVTLANGETVETDVLVGADGIHSVVRRCLWGEEPKRHSGYTAWRGICPNQNLWPAGLFVEHWGDGQLFGTVALNPEEVYWFATKVADEQTESDADTRLEILQRFADWPSPVHELIESTAPEKVLRNEIYDLPPRFPWGEGRITLLGDAIHPMTPNLGQGGCQAIEDAVVLANELAHASTLEQGLRQYEQKRHPRTKKFVTQSRMFTSIAHGQYAWSRLVRSTLFRWLPEGFKKRQMEQLYRFKL